MAKALYQKSEKTVKKDSNARSRQNPKRVIRIIGIATLSLLLASCGTPSAEIDGTSAGLEASITDNNSDMENITRESDIGEAPESAEIIEEPQEWPEEHDSCEVQELSGYLYEHTCVSPYASVEITISDSEVIGVRKQEPNTVLVNTVRYMAASFTDYGGEPGMGWGDGTIPNVGADQWAYPYLHNLFEAAKEQFEN